MLLLSPCILGLINCIKLILFTHAYHNSLLICKVGRQLSNIAVNDVVAFPSSYPVDLDPGHFCSHLDF